jgi:hypothetical protein
VEGGRALGSVDELVFLFSEGATVAAELVLKDLKNKQFAGRVKLDESGVLARRDENTLVAIDAVKNAAACEI